MEVVDSVIDVFNMVAGLKKITIREEKPEKLPVCTDIDMLKTIIHSKPFVKNFFRSPLSNFPFSARLAFQFLVDSLERLLSILNLPHFVNTFFDFFQIFF